jgi:predicted methyltransferase
MKIEFTTENDQGEEITRELPARNVVCPGCDGHGTHLNRNIGEHAYTAEEFRESFDEEEAREYFTRGGIYDVTCETCGGRRVVPVVDRDAADPEVLKLYDEIQKEEAEYRAMCRSEDRMLRAMGGDW